MKKLFKNKVVVLAICVAIVSCTYFVVQKAIQEYSFKTNGDIIRDDDLVSEDAGVDSDGSSRNEDKEKGKDNSGVIDEDETDLVLEETREEPTAVTDEGSASEAESGDGSKIYVYITGEVNVPGVVVLNENSRIVDAINGAGGTTAKADISKVNLVYIVEDGMKINIPNSNDLKNNPDFEYITMNSGDGASDSGSSSVSSSGTGDSSGGKSGSGSSFSAGYSVVNINTASQTELESLPGIGPSLALKIINYRNENGKFSSIDQIKNVSGIGDAKFENMKSLITV